MTRRVEFAETDLAGVVHFSNYFRMMEQAEHAFLHSLDLSAHGRCADDVVGWPRVAAGCDFLRPLRFGDEVEIHLAVEQMSQRSIRYRFTLRRIDPAPVETVARGHLIAACARFPQREPSFHTVPIPDDFLQKIEPVPGRPPSNP